MENFEDLKVGDKVIVTNGRVERVESVRRLTKTLVFVGYKSFRKNDGREYGGRPFGTMHLRKATPEAIAEIEKEMKRNDILDKVTRFRWGILDNKTLEKVYELINK